MMENAVPGRHSVAPPSAVLGRARAAESAHSPRRVSPPAAVLARAPSFFAHNAAYSNVDTDAI